MANNILQQVVTYNLSELAYLQNFGAFISTANKRFKNFQNITGNLGDTVAFDLPPRLTVANSLVANFQSAIQRIHHLTIDKEVSTAIDFTNQEFLLNVRDYMERFGKSAVGAIASQIEADVAFNAVSNTYRFFGDGTAAAVGKYENLAKALAIHRNAGNTSDTKCYISDTLVPDVVGSGLGLFTPTVNERERNSWEIGSFSQSTWYQSNLLPVHEAGTEGGSTLVIGAVTTDASGAVTDITLNGTTNPNDLDCFKKYDKCQIADLNGYRVRATTFFGNVTSATPVQFRVEEDAASDGGNQVTIKIYPPLQANPALSTCNVSQAIVPGMSVKVLPTHRAGLITSGNPLFLAMPRLPEEVPYPTAAASDPETGASLRSYYGSLFAQNKRGFVHDAIYGSTLVGEYATMLALPV